MSTYIITVSKIEDHLVNDVSSKVDGSSREIFRQTFDEFNLSKFVVALNKAPRTRKMAKVKQEART